jgi:ferredoxin
VSDVEERTVQGLKVQIDRSLCVGFGDCVTEAPEGFRMDGENIVAFGEQTESVDRERLLRACEICPVDALTAWDGDGNQLIP